MVNTRQKMRATNSIILKYLKEKGFTDIYCFPHTRFSKDYIVGSEGFDAIGWREDSGGKKKCWLFQFKTNKACPEKTLEKYKKLTKKYDFFLCFASRFNKRKLTKKHPKEVELWIIDEKGHFYSSLERF